MKIAVFYYDGFAEFEIVLAFQIFRNHELIAVALEDREYRGEAKMRVCIDQVIGDVDIDSIDLLIIPGGDPAALVDNQELKGFIAKLVEKDKKVAAICGGSELLAAYGFLKGKRCTGDTCGVTPESGFYRYYAQSLLSDDYVVVDGNIITAQGQAYVEFAVELARQMGMVKNEEGYNEGVRWFKNMR